MSAHPPSGLLIAIRAVIMLLVNAPQKRDLIFGRDRFGGEGGTVLYSTTGGE